ncbi:MAG: helix-turn-helix domain-containing protein [Planctomycetaceae bacterium]|jgi:transcriptional regulator with XRE-family HTH domain
MSLDDLAFVIRRKREVMQLTQRELAERSGIHLRSINNLESAKGNPSWDTLVKLAEVLKLEIVVRPQ